MNRDNQISFYKLIKKNENVDPDSDKSEDESNIIIKIDETPILSQYVESSKIRKLLGKAGHFNILACLKENSIFLYLFNSNESKPKIIKKVVLENSNLAEKIINFEFMNAKKGIIAIETVKGISFLDIHFTPNEGWKGKIKGKEITKILISLPSKVKKNEESEKMGNILAENFDPNPIIKSLKIRDEKSQENENIQQTSDSKNKVDKEMNILESKDKWEKEELNQKDSSKMEIEEGLSIKEPLFQTIKVKDKEKAFELMENADEMIRENTIRAMTKNEITIFIDFVSDILISQNYKGLSHSICWLKLIIQLRVNDIAGINKVKLGTLTSFLKERTKNLGKILQIKGKLDLLLSYSHPADSKSISNFKEKEVSKIEPIHYVYHKEEKAENKILESLSKQNKMDDNKEEIEPIYNLQDLEEDGKEEESDDEDELIMKKFKKSQLEEVPDIVEENENEEEQKDENYEEMSERGLEDEEIEEIDDKIDEEIEIMQVKSKNKNKKNINKRKAKDEYD